MAVPVAPCSEEGQAVTARSSLRLVSRRRQPADVFQELALKSPADFAALVLLARAALERLRDVAS